MGHPHVTWRPISIPLLFPCLDVGCTDHFGLRLVGISCITTRASEQTMLYIISRLMAHDCRQAVRTGTSRHQRALVHAESPGCHSKKKLRWGGRILGPSIIDGRFNMRLTSPDSSDLPVQVSVVIYRGSPWAALFPVPPSPSSHPHVQPRPRGEHPVHPGGPGPGFTRHARRGQCSAPASNPLAQPHASSSVASRLFDSFWDCPFGP